MISLRRAAAFSFLWVIPFSLHADTLLNWNFNTSATGQPIRLVDASPGAAFDIPLEAAGEPPMCIDHGPEKSRPALKKSASFTADKGGFLRSQGLGKKLILDVGQPFTLEAWVRPVAESSGVQYIVSNRDPQREATGFGLYAKRNGKSILPSFIVTSHGNSVGVAATESLQAGQWYLLTATRDSEGFLALYVNGTKVATSHNKAEPNILDSFVNVTVGRSPHTGAKDSFWNGDIAAIRLSNEQLEPQNFLLAE